MLYIKKNPDNVVPVWYLDFITIQGFYFKMTMLNFYCVSFYGLDFRLDIKYTFSVDCSFLAP